MNKRTVITVSMLLVSGVAFSQNKSEVRHTKRNIKTELKMDSHKVTEANQKIWKATKKGTKEVADEISDSAQKFMEKVHKEAPVKWKVLKENVEKDSKVVAQKMKKASKKIKLDLKKKKHK